MSTYPIVKIAGIDLNDPSGRWEALPGTLMLPHFPGRVETRVPTPGVPGYRGVAYAPGEPMKIPIVMRFNAVQTYANAIVPGGSSDRMAAIHQNIDTFFYATALARQGYAGLVEISKEVMPGEVRVASARMIASAEPEFDVGSDHATMTLIFETPSGVWLDKEYTVYETTTLGGASWHKVDIPSGTAPQTENQIAFRGPYRSNTPPYASFANELGIGFDLGFTGADVDLNSDDWVIIDTTSWSNGYRRNASTLPGSAWTASKPHSQIQPLGRPLGNALTLLPSTTRGKATLRYRVPLQTQLQIRTRRAWY